MKDLQSVQHTVHMASKLLGTQPNMFFLPTTTTNLIVFKETKVLCQLLFFMFEQHGNANSTQLLYSKAN